MTRTLRLIIFTAIAFIVVRATTFGWRFFGKTNMDTGQEGTELVKRLKQHVYKLSHEIGDRSVFRFSRLEEAADYIEGQFTSFGYNVEFHKYSVSGQEVRNIIAVKKGRSLPGRTLIVGAHYDSCFNPGADDNASAVAGLLELARLVSKQDTDCSIRFIAFVNEEPPFFKTKDMGSCVYAKFVKERGDDIKAVVIFEMIGYYADKPNSQRYPPFFATSSPAGLLKILRKVLKTRPTFPLNLWLLSVLYPALIFPTIGGSGKKAIRRL